MYNNIVMKKVKNTFYTIMIYAYIFLILILTIVGGHFAFTKNLHSLPWFIATVINLSLALFVYLKDRKNQLNITFAITNILIASWTFDNFGLHFIRDANFALFWSMIFRSVVLLLPAVFFHFAVILSKNNDKKRKAVYISYIISIMLSILNFTPYFRNEMIRREWAYFPKFGITYFIFIINFAFWAFFSLLYIFKRYKNTESVSEKNQLSYYFISIAIAVIFGLLTQTLYGLGVKIYPIGGFANIFYTGIVAYAIVKRQLIDITIIIRRSIIYTILIILVIITYISFTVNLHSFPWFIATIVNLSLALFVYLKDRKNQLNKIFALVSIFIASWSLDVFGFHIIKDDNTVRYWGMIMRVGTIFISAALFHFTIILSKNINKKNYLVYISYIISVFFAILNFTPYFKNEFMKREWAYFPKFSGLLYWLLIINFVFWIFLGLLFVFKRYQSSESTREKNQLSYFFMATAVAAIFGLLPQTLYGLGIRIYPIGGFGNMLYVGIIAYSIVKHQLMDITVIIRRSIIYTTLTVSIVGMYAFIVGIITGLISIFNIADNHEALMIINGFAGLSIAIVFLPIKNKIQFAVDKLFFKDRYDYIETLKNLSRDVTTIFDLDKLLRVLLTKIIDAMHIDKGYVMVYDSDKESYVVRFSKGMEHEQIRQIRFGKEDKLLNCLEKNKTILMLDENGNDFKELKSHKVSICIPLMVYDKLVGILNLGNKLSEDMYTSEDLRLLTTISNQAAIAIENAQLSTNMRVLEKNILHSDKLSALGTVASSITHEIKNPLASIKTFCQLMALKFENPEFRERFNNIVPSEIDRIENIVGQLLNFSKSSNIKYSESNVNNIIDNLLELLQYEAYKYDINIVKQYKNIPPIMADEEQLKQVFMNLVLNAIQAMPNGGKLEISTDKISNKGIEYISVTIKDTGIGISEEFMKKIFKPFNTTKPNGTGLGLSIINRIVKEHNGTIEVNSELNKGTTFVVKLPVENHN